MKKKITQEEFEKLYKNYYYCFGVSYSTAPTNFNNNFKKSEARKFYEKLTPHLKNIYFERVKEVVGKYLIKKDSRTTFNFPKLLDDKGYLNDLSGLNLSDKNFSGFSFEGTHFKETNLKNCDFILEASEKDHYSRDLIADFTNAVFQGTNMRGAKIKFCSNLTISNVTFCIQDDAFKDIHVNNDQSTKDFKMKYKKTRHVSSNSNMLRFFPQEKQKKTMPEEKKSNEHYSGYTLPNG